VGNLVTRPAQVADIPGLARLHVESWRETFRGLFSDALLDDPDAVGRRERFWTAALTDERYSKNTAATATLDGKVVGLAMSGPALDEDATWESQSGLWVVDPSPRAQAFYRKHGFEPDGRHRVDDGVRVIRMTRPPR
jgi:hypothetical protein